MIASLALMSICLCSCEQMGSIETSKATTKPHTQTTVTHTPETTATTTPTAEPVQTSAPQQTPASSQNTKKETLTLTSKADTKNYKNVENITLGDSINADFVLHSDTTLKDVTVNSVDYNLETCKITKKLYEKSQFTSTDAIHIKTYIPDLCGNLLVTYKTSNDKTVYKLVGSNMEDGTIELQDIDSKLIKNK